MPQDEIGRRKFLSSLAAVSVASQIGLRKGLSNQPGDDTKPRFGPPIEQSWTVDHDSEHAEIGAVREDALYATFMNGGRDAETELARINRYTGTKEWSETIDSYVYPPIENNGRVYFDGYQKVYCWDASTGEELWTRSLDGDLILVESVNDSVLVTTHFIEQTRAQGVVGDGLTTGRLLSLNPVTGETNWTSTSGIAIRSPEIVENQVFANETQFVVSDDTVFREQGRLVSFDSEDGSRIWESEQINPRYFSETGGELLVNTTNDDFVIFELDGDIRSLDLDSGNDYYYTEDRFFIERLEGGLAVYNHSGNELTEPLYPSTDIERVSSGTDGDLLLLGTADSIIAIDLEDLAERWQKSLPSSPQGITSRRELVFTHYDNNQTEALDAHTGETVWQDELASVNPLSWKVHDGFLYAYDTEAPIYGFSGTRGRALSAVNSAELNGNSASGTIAGILGWRDKIANANTAISNGNYERAIDLINQLRRRQTGIQGLLASGGISGAYAATRVLGGKIQQARLESAIEAVESRYPIEDGKLSGAEPTNLLAQAQTANSSLDSLFPIKLRGLLSNDYTDLIARLNEIADRRQDLVETSETLASVDANLLPESWVADLRDAIKNGHIRQISELVFQISKANRLFSQVGEFTETVEQSSLSVSTANYSGLLSQELGDSDSIFDTMSLSDVLGVLSDGIVAYESHRHTLDIFDLAYVKSTLVAALEEPHNLEKSTINEINNFDALLQASATFEENLSKVNFSQVDPSRDACVRRAMSLFESGDVDAMREIAEDMNQLHAGRWSQSDFFTFSPIEFEYLTAALFDDMGYEVAVTDEQGDKGIDVIARNHIEVLAIQVKQYSEGNNIGRPTIQQTIGAMAQVGADKAMVVTSSGFTNSARQASQELGDAVDLINGGALVQMLSESTLYPSSNASQYQSRASASRSNYNRESGRSSNSQTGSKSDGMLTQEAYEILDIDPPASEDEIQTHYRQKVKQTHPDTGGDEEDFKQVQKAYSLLIDE
ncbi:restriction endonuclease [Haloarcula sp. CBA1127]|uniref:restriction endonuclease n=1 Tax=Haloarcula sp. CBA1127 TaxID=1765055 RepID=UPI0009ADD883|nr:restriction endonuclease [Haloarcula sp. CBA1127]